MKLFESITKFLKRSEHYVVIEQMENGFELTEGYVNEKKKEIKIINRISGDNLYDFKSPLFAVDNVVLALDSMHATTIQEIVHIKNTEKQEIDESGLEQIIFHGLWKFINTHRVFAAKKMSASEIDLVLTNVEITSVFLGDRQVINPVGFNASDISFSFRGTFVTRDFLDTVEKIKSWTKTLTVIEENAFLSLVTQKQKGVVIYLENEKSYAFKLADGGCTFETSIPFGFSKITKVFEEELHIDGDSARLFVNAYVNNKMSKKMKFFAETHMNAELSEFADMVKNLTSKLFKKTKQPIYIASRENIPHFLEWFEKKTNFEIIKFDYYLDKLGIIVNYARNAKENEVSTFAMVHFAHQFLYPKHELVNQLLKRRARWLTSNTQTT